MSDPDHEPDWKAEVRRRMPGATASNRELDIVEEVAQHLESRYRELLDRGIEAHDARRQVLAGLDADARRPDAREAWFRSWRPPMPPMSSLPGRRLVNDSLVRDCRYALRMFARRPAFTAVALSAIAIGVAAITTVFTLVSTVLGDSPVSRFDRVVLVWQQDPTTGRDRITLSPFEFAEYRRAAAFDATAAIRGVRLNVIGSGGTPLAASGIQVSQELFDTLGVTPLLGRTFSTSPDQRAQEVVVTYEFWQSHLAADPGILGKPLSIRSGFTADPDAARDIDGTRIVVGVLPARMSLPYRAADLWIPLPPEQTTAAPGGTGGSSSAGGLLVFARLGPGVTVEAASAQTETIARRLLAQFPERNKNIQSRLVTLREETVGDVTPTLVMLSAAVALLGLIVCANIGNMLLSRLAERQREFVVRGALGASRGRLLQQLLTESAVLGASGGASGLLIAWWMTRTLAASGPATIPRVADVTVDIRAFTAAVLASLVMTAVFGLLPALKIVRLRGNQLAQRAGNTADVGRLRERLTIAEFALAFVVLVGAGLVFVSSRALEATSVGYDPSSSLTFRVSLPRHAYAAAARRAAFFESLLDRLRALPGVTHAGAVSILPQMDTNRSIEFDLDGGGGTPGSPDRPTARFRIATPGYFESLGIRVVNGRTFQASDLSGGGGGGAVAISRSLAERFWPDTNPIGRQIRLRLPTAQQQQQQQQAQAPGGIQVTIVGVVEDVRQWINTPPDPTLYWANAQQPEYAFVVRTAGDPSSLAAAATRAIRDLDPDQPVFDMRTMRERLDESQQLTYERFRTVVMSGFGFAALLLAGLGIYGVVRYSVVQRTQEFGIRIALGATPNQVLGMVLRQSLRSTAIGVTIGILGSLAAARLLGSVLYGGSSAQPAIIVAVALLLAGLATAAALGPARRAANTDPLIALRRD